MYVIQQSKIWQFEDPQMAICGPIRQFVHIFTHLLLVFLWFVIDMQANNNVVHLFTSSGKYSFSLLPMEKW